MNVVLIGIIHVFTAFIDTLCSALDIVNQMILALKNKLSLSLSQVTSQFLLLLTDSAS